MMRASRYTDDAAYLTHPRSAALTYEPLPAETLHALADIRTLQRHTQDPALLTWLEDRAVFLTAACADCPPVVVRNVKPAAPRKPRKANWFNSRGRRS